MKNPIKIAITGASGHIAYSILFRIASGDMLGKDQPVILQLYDLEVALNAVNGVVMELQDCAFPLLVKTLVTSDLEIAFADIDIAILLGSKPRTKGMERKDLLNMNGKIFIAQGQALSKVAKKDAKVLVVGNPANTNALILKHYAKNLNPNNITAMMRLDHNRGISQLGLKLNKPVEDIKKFVVWGNHSATQYPDTHFLNVLDSKLITDEWLETTFIPMVQQRGAQIIEARGASSAASAASAAINHIHDWIFGTKQDDFVSMAVVSDGSYGITKGLIFGFPVVCSNGSYKIINNLTLTETQIKKLKATETELLAEQETIKELLM